MVYASATFDPEVVYVKSPLLQIKFYIRFFNYENNTKVIARESYRSNFLKVLCHKCTITKKPRVVNKDLKS